jgi:tape measure domain-containing protein
VAEQGGYRLELKTITLGVEEVTNELRTVNRFIESTRRRFALLNKMEMSLAARLNDQVTEPIRKVEGKWKPLKFLKTSWKVVIGAHDLATGAFNRIGRMARALAGTVSSLSASISDAISRATEPGILRPLGMAGEFEQTKITFESLLGSDEKAQRFLGELQDYAEKTTFEFVQLADTSKKLLALGVAAEDILPMMTAVGNAATGLGLGAEGIDKMILALGKMRTKSKVSVEDMLRLTETGIPAWDILAKKMGMTTQQVMKLSEDGLLPAEKAVDALIEGMNQRFPNMMDRQSQSLLGMWSNMKEVFNIKIVLRWGQGLAAALKPRFEQLTKWINENADTISRWGERLSAAASAGADFVLRRLEGAFAYIKRQYLDNPEFQNLNFGGKIRFILEDLDHLFEEWWKTGGKSQVDKISRNIGSTLGSTLNGFIMGALGAVDPGDQNESPFLQAGSVAGHAFLESFLKAFDAEQIAKKAKEAFLNLQPTWLGGETSSPLGQALVLLLDAWIWTQMMKIGRTFGKIFGKFLKRPLKAVMRLFRRDSAAEATAEINASVEKAANQKTATAMDRSKKLPWYRRWFGGLKRPASAKATRATPNIPAGPSAVFPQNYRPAGKRFWENIPLDRVHSRDEIVRMANSGKLKRYNDLEKAFGGRVPKTSWWKRLIGGGKNKGLGFLSRTDNKFGDPFSIGLSAASTASTATETSKAAIITDDQKKPGFLKRIMERMISQKAKNIFKLAGKANRPLGIALDAVNIATAEPGKERNKAIGGTIGGSGGFYAGAAGGAALGSVIPGVGTVIGGIIGGILGSFGGEWLGTAIVDKIYDLSTKPKTSDNTTNNTTNKTMDKVSMPTPTMRISEDQLQGLTDSINNLKPQTNFNVSIHPGSVQVHIRESEIDENTLLDKVGIPLVKNIMKAYENRV